MHKTLTQHLAMAATPEFRKTLGQRIKATRKERGLTQKELAQRMGFSYQQLNKYEGGFNVPSADLLQRFAQELDVSADFLLTGQHPNTASPSNLRLAERLRIAEQFPADDQETVIKLLDAMIMQHRAKSAVAPVDRNLSRIGA
jgi:transcriptional regulator with XRE-family HTH domain